VDADLLSTIAAIQQQTTSAGIFEIVSKVIDAYGFERFIITGLPDRGVEDVRPFILLSGWSSEWYDRYTSLGYVHLDPVARYCFSTTTPFHWSDAPYDRATDLPARRVMDEARDFGLDRGFCVPIHMEGGMHGVVSLVGGPANLDANSRVELHMLALYAHGRLRFLNTRNTELVSKRTITAREAEVLKWAASGKTASEIATITGLSERTINQHCENAQKRLGTNNRTHTVVEAIRHKLIAL
jgi:LuxR family quorum sensing-dependent transcriptional regulator